MKQTKTISFINQNRTAVSKKLNEIIKQWEAWSREVDKIVDQLYDRNTQSEVFADGEDMIQKHEILQSKTLTFLNSNIKNHNFISGLDGSHCDRTDLRLKHRVKHRLQELRVLRECLKVLPTQEGDTADNLTTFKVAHIWENIEKDFDINKRAFGKKINFVRDTFKKKTIFRDIEQSYYMANIGFSKPAIILAGSVIEELLRLYLAHKHVKPTRDSFDSYIKACEEGNLLKSAISKLTDSVRQFRNLVHLEKEISSKYSLSKANAKGAVSSIFVIANDF